MGCSCIGKTAAARRNSRCMFFAVATVAAVHSLVDLIFEIQDNAMLFVALLAMGMPTAPD